MEQKKLQAAIEAILFAMGGSVELKKLAQAIGHDEETTKKIIRQMMDRYEKEDRGIRIIELEASFQMCTKKEMYEYLIRVAKQPKKQVLTDVLLETLSIIAYKQPVTKMEIEKIRGVKSDHAVNRLVEYNLVYEVGRLDAPGRPALFATTEEFLRRFGIGSTQNLPTPDPETAAEIRMEVEEELKGSGELLPEDEVLLDEIPIAEMRAGAEEAAVTRQESEAGFTEAGSADNNRNELQPKSADNQEDIQ